MPSSLSFHHVLTPQGLLAERRLVVSDDGRIESIEPAVGPCDGFLALPGMPNAHSHAFQRALSGFGERTRGNDSFWSWRDVMYRLANRVTPEDMRIVAEQAFLEMLCGGFTSVAEFHYIHHLPDGRAGPEMAQAVVDAARAAGIHLVLLPVFYQSGGFKQPARPEQRRFLHDSVESYCRLLEALPKVPLGIAPHSLRAVPPDRLRELIARAREVVGEAAPIHIHIGEQRREVEDCRVAFGASPIELLTRSVELDAHWNLVHATHADASERELIIERGATVVICPITEAYLGDGLFAADEFARAGGRFAIGSDSNCRIDAVEELRLLEYGQRLRCEQRARFASATGLGGVLWQRAADGGGAALAQPVGVLAPGQRADLVVLDEDGAPWLGHGPDSLLDAFLVGGSRYDIAAVYVGGKRLVDHGEVHGGEASRRAFAAAVRCLSAN
ncbi:MAG: formimidoylglutamate deiminase [Gammaproteobacteria bacterium]